MKTYYYYSKTIHSGITIDMIDMPSKEVLKAYISIWMIDVKTNAGLITSRRDVLKIYILPTGKYNE